MPKETNAPTNQPALMSLQAAAKEYGPPYTSWRDLVIQGHLPRVTLGDSRRIWVKRSDVERLIANSTESGVR